MVHSPALGVEILRDAGIDFAALKIQSGVRQGLKRLIALLDEAPAVEGVGVHHRHVGEHRPVLLLTIGKAEHPAHIEFQLVEVRVQPVAPLLFFVEVFVGTAGNGLHLFLRGGPAHDGEHLSGKHHACAGLRNALQGLPVVVIVTVEPAVPPVRDPLLTADVLHQPVRFALQVLRQLHREDPDGPAADIVGAAPGVSLQDRLFLRQIVAGHGRRPEQLLQLLRQLHVLPGLGQPPEKPRQVLEIACVGAGEGHALPPLRGHVQGVVPVGPPEAEDVVLPHLIKGGEVLNQQVLQNTAGVDLAGSRPLPVSVRRVPLSVDLCTPHSLGVLEVGDLRAQDIQVPRLVDVELGGHQGPEGVVHPDSGDAVAVRDKVPQALSDDGGVGSVHPHAAEAGLDHLPHAAGVHQQQRQAVLPEVPPAPASPAIVVVGQEGTAVDPPQKGLEAHPAHQAVEVRRAGLVADVYLVLPISFCALQGGMDPFLCAVGR